VVERRVGGRKQENGRETKTNNTHTDDDENMPHMLEKRRRRRIAPRQAEAWGVGA
jgi:hypothetical protein